MRILWQKQDNANSCVKSYLRVHIFQKISLTWPRVIIRLFTNTRMSGMSSHAIQVYKEKKDNIAIKHAVLI